MDLHGIKLIEEYRNNPDKFYPMPYVTDQIPERNEYGEVNIGWWAGLLDERRPFFAECWAVDGITVLTISVSAEGIEDITVEELDRLFQDAGYYKQRDPGQNLPHVDTFVCKEGYKLFVINLTVGVEDEPAMIDGGWIESWDILNEYNRKPQA
ncbi:MAG: hypothetical protein Q4D71_13330 [Oscillospiraceae bacterium]|nr:hypothetical protein [Oscillospiraceae bacterium]